MARVLVTGGTGFLGSSIANHLVGKGLSVRVTSRESKKPSAQLDGHVEFFGGFDLSAETDWFEALKDVDYVVHCAARVHVLNETSDNPKDLFNSQNFLGTKRLAEQAAECGISRFVFISSIGVNGNVTHEHPFTSEDTPAPTTPYASSKRLAEAALLDVSNEHSMETVSIRPPLIYGKNAPGNFVQLERMIDRGIPLPFGLTNNRRNFVSVDNVVGFVAHLLLAEVMKSGIFLVSDGEEVSTKQFVRAIAQAKHKRLLLLPVPTGLFKVFLTAVGKSSLYEKLFGDLRLDIEQTKKQTGWVPELGTIDSISKMLSEK